MQHIKPDTDSDVKTDPTSYQKYLIPFSRIEKNTSTMTFIETISLFFNVCEKYSLSTNKRYTEFSDIYNNFIQDYQYQLYCEWPKIIVNDNKINNRCDVLITNGIFLKSNNILTFLLRLIYIENHKKEANLLHKIYNETNNGIENMTILEIIDLMIACVNRYLLVYANNFSIEYSIATKILELL